MAKQIVEVDGMSVSLRRPEVAAVLAWLFPGAGHFYQGRQAKALIFCVSIMTIYILGMLMGAGKVVYFSWLKEDRRWQYFCQVGVGVPALPALVQAWHLSRAPTPLWSGFMARPQDKNVLSKWHSSLSAGFDLGSLYTMIAGLLNYLVVFDAYGGPLPPPISERKKRKRDDAPNNEANDESSKSASANQ